MTKFVFAVLGDNNEIYAGPYRKKGAATAQATIRNSRLKRAGLPDTYQVGLFQLVTKDQREIQSILAKDRHKSKIEG